MYLAQCNKVVLSCLVLSKTHPKAIILIILHNFGLVDLQTDTLSHLGKDAVFVGSYLWRMSSRNPIAVNL